MMMPTLVDAGRFLAGSRTRLRWTVIVVVCVAVVAAGAALVGVRAGLARSAGPAPAASSAASAVPDARGDKDGCETAAVEFVQRVTAPGGTAAWVQSLWPLTTSEVHGWLSSMDRSRLPKGQPVAVTSSVQPGSCDATVRLAPSGALHVVLDSTTGRWLVSTWGLP